MHDASTPPLALVRAVLAALPVPGFVIDAEQRVVACNPAGEAAFGEGLTGRHFALAWRQPALVDAVERCLQDHAPRTVAYRAGHDSAQTRYDAHVAMLSGTGLLLSFHSVTDLDRAGQMRRDFVANVSHELRTPLTALIGFIETLRGPAREDEAARDRFLGVMAEEAERMNRLVAGLLSLSRVEQDERLRPTALLDLRDVIASAARTLGPLAAERNVELTLHPGAAAIRVPGDADQLVQVFANLIENAINYGGSNRQVEIRRLPDGHDPVLRGRVAQIAVTDHGPGIAPIHLPRLTERFYRADTHRSRLLGGTGLGLAIVKHILNRHRGRLKVESTEGHGATFTVLLPVARGTG